MMPTPEVLAALGCLNSHARTAWNGLRRTIYDYKSMVTWLLVSEKVATVRFVRWTGKCNRCDNGWFTHWDWSDGHKVLCRDCGGKGQRTLRFTETTLPDGQIWHHPWFVGDGKGHNIARVAYPNLTLADCGDYHDGDGVLIDWHDAGEWSPNLPGNKLERDELVTLLNVVERWVEQFPQSRRPDALIVDAAFKHLHSWSYPYVSGEPSHSYVLDLGRAPTGCFVCGTKDRLAGYSYGRMTSLFHWSLPVCVEHGEGPNKVPHPDGPPPAELLTPPVLEWLARHERVVRDSW